MQEQKQQSNLLKDLRQEYTLKPNLSKVTIKTVSLLEGQIDVIISDIKKLVNDVYAFQIDQHDLKKCKSNEDKIEMISLIHTFKFFRDNGVSSPNIHDLLWVQKEIYCYTAALFVKHGCNWCKIPLSE